MKKLLYTVLFYVPITISQNITAPLNTTLFGQLDPRSGSYASCFGYTAANGKEYAIIGNQTGTCIIDINSAPITEVAFIPGPSSSWKEMKVYQNYCYVVTENRTSSGYGIQIIDLKDLPIAATLVNTINPTYTNTVTGGVDTLVSSHSISIEGKTLYLNGSRARPSNLTGGIVALDLTDPVNPTLKGMYQGLYIHDSAIYNDTIYGAAIYSNGGIDIIDARDKANMKRINLVKYPGSGTHNTDLTNDKKYILSTDEIGTENILRVWDRTNIMDVKLAAKFRASKTAISHNAHVRGDYAYIAYYTEGLRIVDLKEARIPVEVGHYDTYPNAAQAYEGAWGAYPYFASGKILISDMTTGLYVVEFPGTLAPNSIKVARAFVTIRDSISNLPIPNATVEILNNPNTFVSDGSGVVGIGGLFDTMTIKITPPNTLYIVTYKKLTLELDKTINLTINLPKTSSSVNDEKIIPQIYSLSQNFPNPFNPSTTINFYLGKKENISLKVYDVLGNEIANLANGDYQKGNYSVDFKGENLASGIYFYRLSTLSGTISKRMILSK